MIYYCQGSSRGRVSSNSNTTVRISKLWLLVLVFLGCLLSTSLTTSSSSSSSSSSSFFPSLDDQDVLMDDDEYDDDDDDGYHPPHHPPLVGVSGGSCSSLTTCQNCTRTYSCHWCDFDQACHARGSIHGCAWGGRCDRPPSPSPSPPKENSTCASHATCSDCATSSHFCHWCEHDNACHAFGSRYGCAIGVDCYSNGRCRRNVSEPIGGGGGGGGGGGNSPSGERTDQDAPPTGSLLAIGVVGLILVCCLSCCHYFATNVKGAYDDLATITMAASLAPMSVIGGPTGHFYTTLEPHPEEEEEEDEEEEESDETGIEGGESDVTDVNGQLQQEEPPPSVGEGTRTEVDDGAAAAVDQNGHTTAPVSLRSQQQQQQQQDQVPHDQSRGEDNPYYLMNENDTRPANVNNHHRVHQEARPLLHPSFNGSVMGMEEPRHMKRLYRACSVLYFVSVGLVVLLTLTAIYFYPTKPVYNVCNDAVAWKKIMGNIVALKLDASFEILISLKNANRMGATLDRGKGSFRFEGEPIGRYEIPPVSAPASAITDIMLVTHVTPDKFQALRLAEAYYMGKLMLEAEFEGTIRVPALWDFTFDIHIKNIEVNVNELSDRSLCHCPTWDDGRNHSTLEELPFFLDDQSEHIL